MTNFKKIIQQKFGSCNTSYEEIAALLACVEALGNCRRALHRLRDNKRSRRGDRTNASAYAGGDPGQCLEVLKTHTCLRQRL